MPASGPIRFRLVSEFASEVIQRFLEPFCELDPRLPSQQRARLGDIGAAARRIVHRQVDKAQFALRSGDLEHGLRALQNRELHRIADVDREVLLAVRQAGRGYQALPPGRQILVKHAFQDLSAVPLDQRDTVLNSARYQSTFSPYERNILSTLLRAEPYEPPR